jgi:predicted alpha-1,2-mannosidase
MRSRFHWVVVVMALTGCTDDATINAAPEPLEQTDLYGVVDPFIASGGLGFAIGASYPGPALPFAMIHPGPDTRDAKGANPLYHCSGYFYDDPLVGGFSLTRMQGTGVPDYGTFAFMPTDGISESKRSESGYAVSFTKENESAKPGYYRVLLDNGIDVEITSTLRTAAFRYTFPDGVDPVVLVDLDHALDGSVEDCQAAVAESGAMDLALHLDGGLSGRFGGFDIFARAAFDTTPSSIGVWDDNGLRDGETDAAGTDVGAWVRFPAGAKTVEMRVAISFVDADGAQGNLDDEMPAFDFDGVRATAEEVWRSTIGSLEVWGADDRDAIIVASAMYRAHLMPTLMSDVDGRARAIGGDVVTSGVPRYSDFTLWDTYRTLHPWLMLSEDPVNEALMASLVTMAREGGAVPRWSLANGDVHSMVGSPGEIVLAEAAAKGLLTDEQEAYDLARVAAFGPAPGAVGGRDAIEPYLEHGYVPSDLYDGSVSKTQEYAVADGVLGAWAARLGRSDDAAALEQRGHAYEQLYNETSGFFQPKRSDGTWDVWGGPLAGQGPYIEGNAWQYLWMVPNDPDGLAEALGGREAALERLREFFELSYEEEPFVGLRQYYWQGNEPDIHVPWLFAAWGSPRETVRAVRWAMDTAYRTSPDGLDGNDDGGTLSAWVLFATAGLYPLVGTSRYVVAAPLFPRVVLHRAGGDLRIEAHPDPRHHPVPKRILLDGQVISGPYLDHGQLEGEHTLVFEMGQ